MALLFLKLGAWVWIAELEIFVSLTEESCVRESFCLGPQRFKMSTWQFDYRFHAPWEKRQQKNCICGL